MQSWLRYQSEDEEMVSDFVNVSNIVPKIPQFPSSSLLLTPNTAERGWRQRGICRHYRLRSE